MNNASVFSKVAASSFQHFIHATSANRTATYILFVSMMALPVSKSYYSIKVSYHTHPPVVQMRHFDIAQHSTYPE